MMTTTEDRALDWDDERVSTEGGFFRVLDEGVYPFVVSRLERKRYEGGDKMGPSPKAEITLLVVDDGGSVEVKDGLILHSKMQWKIAEFFLALGYTEDPETHTVPIRWNEAVGKEGFVEVTVVSGTKDPSKKFNRVGSYLLPGDARVPEKYREKPQPQAPEQPQKQWSM